MGAMCKDVRGSSAPSLQRLREVVQDKEIIQTHPLEVDRIIRDALGAIYQGNASPQRQKIMLDTFLSKYGPFLTQQPPHAC